MTPKELTPDEANMILRIISQTGPSVKIDISNPDNSIAEVEKFKGLLLKLRKIVEQDGNGSV